MFFLTDKYFTQQNNQKILYNKEKLLDNEKFSLTFGKGCLELGLELGQYLFLNITHCSWKYVHSLGE